MAAKMGGFLPQFHREFRYTAPQLTIKTKPKEEADARRWHRIQQDQRLITIFGSKITNIFPIETEVCELLQLTQEVVRTAA